MTTATELAPVPAHIPPELVVDFDIWDLPDGRWDVQAHMYEMKTNTPRIFWTPRNGGHWVIKNKEDVEAVLRDSRRFSSRRVFFPRNETLPQAVPIESDAPLHTDLRRPLQRALFDKRIDAIEPTIHKLAIDLVEGVKNRGECDFTAEFANVYPLCIFLDQVNLPREERITLRPMIEKILQDPDPAVRRLGHHELLQYCNKIVKERQANPGDDLASILVNGDVDGKKMDEELATRFLSTVFLGGLDTVAAMLAYIWHFLGTHPEHRREMAANVNDDAFLQAASEELFRRHAMTLVGRIVTQDLEFNGIRMAFDDTVLPMTMTCGMEKTEKVPDPLNVDFKRGCPTNHLTFGAGPHMCPGQFLARREIRLLLREWFNRIPEFEVVPGHKPKPILGITTTIDAIPLRWKVA